MVKEPETGCQDTSDSPEQGCMFAVTASPLTQGGFVISHIVEISLMLYS